MTDYKDRPKFIVVDGNSLAHRAFYALPLLTNRQGEFTNAAYGFTTMLFKVLAQEKPDYVAVAFDKGKITFRHEQYQEYKGHRKSTPAELRPQFPLIKKILGAMKIAVYEMEGYEADDLIGTLVKEGEKEGFYNLIITGDRDALQLVSPQTHVLLTRKGFSQVELYDAQTIEEKYGLKPEQMIDLKGLMGDASDNIPGVPGIGEKTALKLVTQFASVENLLDRLDQLDGKKLAEKLGAYREQALLSKQLATIDCCVPLDPCWDRCCYRKPDYQQLLAIFKDLEFKSLIKDVLEEMKNNSPVHKQQEELKDPVTILDNQEEIKNFLSCLEGDVVAVYPLLAGTDYLTAPILAIGLAGQGGAGAFSWRDDDDWRAKITVIQSQLENEHVKLLLHDAKSASVAFRRRGITLQGIFGDTMLAAYLLNPTASTHSLPDIALEHLNEALVDEDDIHLIAGHRARAIYRLSEVLHEKLRLADMEGLYRQLELPLTSVLAKMELEGVALDSRELEAMGQELSAGIEHLTAEIYELAGEEFNLNSPKQLGFILFEKLGLPPLKKTKTGYSTDAEVLESLASKHVIAAKLLEYRQLVKLKSTYIDGLKNLMDPHTGKVHTTFNQTITATGRLSSTEPNLQNIPVRLEAGRRIRKAFIPAVPGHLLLAADYSQIELRVLAHISEDPGLIDAFNHHQDIHTRTAAEVFGVAMEDVTPDMRRQAKAVNFGIVYGISDFGLARDLGISRKQAKHFIERYFDRYPGVKAYMEAIVAQAREDGYVTTLLKRRRYLPDIFSPNRNIRSFGERTAMNTPIQGSAADIIKLAMLKVDKALAELGLQTKMLLQVHDELILEVPGHELETVISLVREAMEQAYPLKVPLEVDIKYGSNWYDMGKAG